MNFKNIKDIEVTTTIKFTLKGGNYIKGEVSIKNGEDLKSYSKRVKSAYLKVIRQIPKGNEMVSREEIQKKLDEIEEKIANDPDLLRKCAEFQKKHGTITPKDLLKEFTI